jgi:ferritin-like metal-binding protein YciE
MRMSVLVAVVALAISTATANTQAQTHAAPQAALDAALEQHVQETDSRREDVLRILQHPEVGAAAAGAGLDIRQATSAVATLSDAELADVAERAAQVDAALAGGQSRVTLSTTMIIIGLLLLILIIVAVR